MKSNQLEICLDNARTKYWNSIWRFKRFHEVTDLIEAHFGRWSEPTHCNRYGLQLALLNISASNPVFVETGTSAYGTDSTRLFDSYIRNFGGCFYSTDINPYPSKRLRYALSKKTKLFVMDSIEFISHFDELAGQKSIDFLYLDSWDVDWTNPLASAKHGKLELEAAAPYLKPGTVIIVDDTPADIQWFSDENIESAKKFINDYGVLPGKGAFYQNALKKFNYSILHHDYNLVIKINEQSEEKLP